MKRPTVLRLLEASALAMALSLSGCASEKDTTA